MRESKIEKLLKRKVEEKGGLCLKWVSPGQTGVPDRIILMPNGKIRFVELKRPGEKVSPVQKAMAKEFINRCLVIYILDSEDAVEWFCDERL